MMRLRWSANLSMLWKEYSFLDRFGRARDAGFDTVEFWWPRKLRPEDIDANAKRSGLRVALINMDAGDLEAGDRGFLNRPERTADVLAAAAVAIDLARALGCPLLNCPVGKDSGDDRRRQEETIVSTLAEIAIRAARAGVTVTLEPLNSFDHPTYLMCSTTVAQEWIERVGPSVALLYDAYHMGAMGDDIVAAPRRLRPAHVQVADWPGRHEPGTGRLPYAAFFRELETLDYEGYVGLEYSPAVSVDDSLKWLRAYEAGQPELAPGPPAFRR